MSEIFDRYLEKVQLNSETGCWDWIAGISKDGYGLFYVEKVVHKAHRLSYQFFVNDLLADQVVHHRCENKLCVNPDHLEAMTKEVHGTLNKKERTHCPRGHKLTEANTWECKDGRKRCATCANEYYWKNRDRISLKGKWERLLQKIEEVKDEQLDQLLKELENVRNSTSK